MALSYYSLRFKKFVCLLSTLTLVLCVLGLGSLLLTFLIVSVNSAPMNLENRRLSSPPKWVNPCGLAAEDFDGDQDVIQLRDEQLLAQVVVQAKTALMHAQIFRDDYVSTLKISKKSFERSTFFSNIFQLIIRFWYDFNEIINQ